MLCFSLAVLLPPDHVKAKQGKCYFQPHSRMVIHLIAYACPSVPTLTAEHLTYSVSHALRTRHLVVDILPPPVEAN